MINICSLTCDKKTAFGQGLQKSEQEKTDYKFLLYTADPVVRLCSFFFARFCKKINKPKIYI